MHPPAFRYILQQSWESNEDQPSGDRDHLRVHHFVKRVVDPIASKRAQCATGLKPVRHGHRPF